MRLVPERLLTPIPHWKGYHRVVLTVKGRRKQYRIHRLAAEAFIPNPENKPTVNHRNGDKIDNRVENLEWATVSENKHHSIDKLGCKPWNTNVRRIKCVKSGVEYCSVAYASRTTGLSYWKIQQALKKGVDWRYV